MQKGRGGRGEKEENGLLERGREGRALHPLIFFPATGRRRKKGRKKGGGYRKKKKKREVEDAFFYLFKTL